jgi:Tetratricopeptide repeat
MKRRVMAIALFAATTACSSTNRDVAIRPVNSEAGAAQDALARGDLLFSRGEHALALDAYRRAMRKDPTDARALNGVAISYAAMGRHDLAREFFELALARAPRDERIHRNFARSLTAQGLRGEADALLAELGGGAPRAGARSTLAQLAGAGKGLAAVSAPAAGAGLERVSMGEVRLRTASAGAALPGRMTAQLSTAIVTVDDKGAATPALSLMRTLNAPIMRGEASPAKALVVARPATAERTAAPMAVATTATARPAKAVASSSGVAGCDADKGVRLRATGYSITLSTSKDDAKAPAKCESMAGGEQDGLFERLWKWNGRLG